MWHVVKKYFSILNPMRYDKVPHWKYYFLNIFARPTFKYIADPTCHVAILNTSCPLPPDPEPEEIVIAPSMSTANYPPNYWSTLGLYSIYIHAVGKINRAYRPSKSGVYPVIRKCPSEKPLNSLVMYRRDNAVYRLWEFALNFIT